MLLPRGRPVEGVPAFSSGKMSNSAPIPSVSTLTAFAGYGKTPTLKAVQRLARRAGFSSWREARRSIVEIIDVLSEFETLACEYGLSGKTSKLISSQLTRIREANRTLLAV